MKHLHSLTDFLTSVYYLFSVRFTTWLYTMKSSNPAQWELFWDNLNNIRLKEL